MTLQTTQHEIIMQGLQKIASECQVILRDRAVISVVSMVQNGRQIYPIMKQVLAFVSVDTKCY